MSIQKLSSKTGGISILSLVLLFMPMLVSAAQWAAERNGAGVSCHDMQAEMHMEGESTKRMSMDSSQSAETSSHSCCGDLCSCVSGHCTSAALLSSGSNLVSKAQDLHYAPLTSLYSSPNLSIFSPPPIS